MKDKISKTDSPKSKDEKALPRPVRVGLGARLRTYFLTGIIVTAPVSITVYLSWLFIDYVDRQVKPFIPEQYNPDTYLPFGLPGTGVVIMVVVLILIGTLAAGLVGRTLVRLGERVLAQMPVIRSIYGALKQIFETVLAHKSTAFRQVVLIQFPRSGIWAIGFATGTTKGEVQKVMNDEVVSVFMPTAPNPTSGYLLFLPRKEVVFLRMTVEEGLKMVISGGVVIPPDRSQDSGGKNSEITSENSTDNATRGAQRRITRESNQP